MFLIEKENHAWQSYHYLYVITVKGELYKTSIILKNLDKLSKKEIQSFIEQLEFEFIENLNEIKVKEMKENSKYIKKDSESYTTRVAFDAGDVYYYAFNEICSINPIIIGVRGDSTIHSKNEYEKKIADWIDEIFEDLYS